MRQLQPAMSRLRPGCEARGSAAMDVRSVDRPDNRSSTSSAGSNVLACDGGNLWIPAAGEATAEMAIGARMKRTPTRPCAGRRVRPISALSARCRWARAVEALAVAEGEADRGEGWRPKEKR